MKRKTAILLALVFLLTMGIPGGAFAATMDQSLEKAIKIAKTKFPVPDTYKFSSSVGTEEDRNVFSLNWRNNDTSSTETINVRIDENGRILGYNKYSQSDYLQTKKLPKLSRQDAKAKADAYIESIEPGLLKKLRYEDNYQGSVTDTSYYLTYYRVEGGIPFYNDTVSVNINRETGALQDYSRQWSDGLAFPAATGVLSASEAQKAYMKNIGLRLIYKYNYTQEAISTFAVYTPVYDNGNYAINAKTGERLRTGNNYYYSENGLSVTFSASKDMRGSAAAVQLNPDELKAVQDASQLMSKEDAEKIARSAKFLNLTPDIVLSGSYLNTNWMSKEDYIWSLQFKQPAGDKRKYDEYISVSVNAKTGEITSFNRGVPSTDSTAKPEGDIAAAKAAVDAFLKEYYPQYYRQVEYDKITSESNVTGNGDNNYFLAYSRLVNGNAFPGNGINVNYENVSHTIIGFDLNWFNLSFPSVDRAMGIEAAGAKLFGNVALGLEYKLEYTTNADAIKVASGLQSSASKKVALVYALKPNKPLNLDITTGSLLNNDGSTYKEKVKVTYSDIKGNAAEKQIMVLAENGVYLDGTEFKPNSAITQQDFLSLLSKTLNYYGPVVTARSSSKDVDDLYAFLQREGIIKQGEKAPASAVTRETAVKFLIRALKYDKVADIQGIFNIGFKDKSSISSGLTGYIAIAAGLGIVDPKSAYLDPKAKLTRGQSAIMIYNYLQS